MSHWTQIPAVPTSAFKEFDITCLPPERRTAVFHSSGTTAQKPSRHFHSAESLAVYEASLLAWFRHQVQPGEHLAILTPCPTQAPNSSLVHMFEVIRRDFGAPDKSFFGKPDSAGSWMVDFEAIVPRLQCACDRGDRILVFGTAFSYVHLLDYLAEKNLQLKLPPGSQIMETGGYKNRSRSLPKEELHGLIVERLGVPSSHILCEYGMSELSSQAYNAAIGAQRTGAPCQPRFRFPPWRWIPIAGPGRIGGTSRVLVDDN